MTDHPLSSPSAVAPRPDLAAELSPELPEDEEYSPSDPASLDVPILYVRLLDEQLQPRRHLSVEVQGRAGRQTLRSDGDGVLFCDGCDPGAYTLSAQLKDGLHVVRVHSLSLIDLEEDRSPYIAIL